MFLTIKRIWLFLRNHFEYNYRWLKNEPMRFKWIDDGGIPVGPTVEVFHLTLHDQMEHQAEGIMTGLVLLEGLKANAIKVLKVEQLNQDNGKTTIQPCWV